MNFKTTIFILAALSFANHCVCQNLGLAKHNELRAKHHSRRMAASQKLISLAKSCAQDYAKRNTIDHKCARELGLGENLYLSNATSLKVNPEKAIGQAIKAWYDEKADYNFNDPGKSKGKTGHFSQLLWSNSTSLGCGVKTVDGNTATCCLYDPPGNTMGENGSHKYYKQSVKRSKK